MPTIIDSLLVKLGLDSSDFTAGKNKVDKGLKDTDKNLNDVTKSAAKFLAVLGGTVAIKRFAEQLIISNAELGRFSKNINENVSTVSAMGNAVEQFGGSAGGLQGTLSMLSKAQTELMLTGESGLIPYFSALGVSMTDAYGKARPVSDLLLDVGEQLKNRTGSYTSAFNMGQMMGIDEGTLTLILKGRKEADLLLKQQLQFNAVSKQQAEQSQKLQQSLVKSRQTFEAWGRQLLSEATPALESLLATFSKVGDWIKSNQEFVSDFLKVIAVGLATVAAATMPINVTAIAIAGLGAAIALLWQDYQTYQKGGDTLVPWAEWLPSIKAVTDALKPLRDLLYDTVQTVLALKDAVVGLFTGDWEKMKFGLSNIIKMPEMGEGNDLADAQKFFESKGWTKEQAAGIVANLQSESNLNPDASGDNGKAYGIAQWHPDRQAKFEKLFGKSIVGSTRAEQMEFVNYELTKGDEQAAGSALRKKTSASASGDVMSRMYERPGDKEGEASKRGWLAEMLFGGSSVRGASAAAPVGALGQRGGGGTVETNIGEINIHTQATDAKGIASDMKHAMDSLFTSQVNPGLM